MENILVIVGENKVIILFVIFILSILILNLVSYFIYNILKIEVVFLQEKLIESEKVLVNSSLRTMTTAIKGFKVAIRKNYLLITNKRIILATNIFSFWTYRFSMNIWFDKETSINKNGGFAENLRLGKKITLCCLIGKIKK